jgi:hypothetical protein
MYRITITEAHPTNKEHILLSCIFEHSADGEVWELLEGAPEAMALPLSAVRGILRAPGGDAEKRIALQEAVRTTARSLPVVRGAAAIESIESLLLGGWPAIVRL